VFFVVLSIMIGAAGAEDFTASSVTFFKNAGAFVFSVGVRSDIGASPMDIGAGTTAGVPADVG
jgi:hypothetical protein